MRKVLLLLAAVVTAAPACAEWTVMGKSVITGITWDWSVDQSTIRNQGSIRRAWIMQDAQNPGDSPFRSIKRLSEYDCKEDRSRQIQALVYAGNGGTGDLLYNETKPLEWSYHPPGTIAADVGRLVCGSKGIAR